MYRQIRGENGTCQEVDFKNMTEQLQEDYLDKYKSVQAEINHVSQLDLSNAESTTYFDKVEMSRGGALKAQE